MRPPTPRLRINSEDFIDNDNNHGPPGDSSSDTQFLSLHSQNLSNNITYSTNNTTSSTSTSSSSANTNSAIISSYDGKIADLVADSDIQDISVL